MIAKCVLLSLALQFAPLAMSAVFPEGTNTASEAKDARQSAPAVISSDPIADLFPSSGQSVDTPQPQQQPLPQALQPSYESWDVLRQYPRYVPLPPPSVIEQKAPEPQKETKEKNDV